MKIAISSKTNSADAELDPRFGRCAYFVVYDTEAGPVTVIENTAAAAAGGAGGAAAQLVDAQGVAAVISGNYGPHAVDALKAFGIRMYISSPDTVAGAFEKFKSGQLKESAGATVVGRH